MPAVRRSRGEIRAVIDVGTNSVKLLIADVEGSMVRPLHEASQQTRLGQGFFETHVLTRGAIEQTAKAVAEFVDVAAGWEPALVKVIATSAARDAKNKEELIRSLEESSGAAVEIISGAQEADWAYKGVTSDPALANDCLLVMDVGGGSTEFILGDKGKRLFAESVRVGSVRLLEKIQVSDPPRAEERMQCEEEIRRAIGGQLKSDIDPELRKVSGVQLVGTGGTSTIMARIKGRMRTFSRELIEGQTLSRTELAGEIDRLWGMPLEQRKQLIGLPSNRADVILTGALIFQEVMRLFELETLRVSTRGLRFAALMD